MPNLVQTLLNIALLRQDPSSLPRESRWVLIVLIANIAISALYLSLPRSTPLPSLALIALVSAASLGVYALLLQVYQRSARTMQVLGAVLGVDCIFMLIAICLVGMFGEGAANLPMLLLLFWSIAVRGRIVSDGLDWPWLAGIALEFALVVVIEIVLTSVIEPPVGTAVAEQLALV